MKDEREAETIHIVLEKTPSETTEDPKYNHKCKE